MNRTEEAYRRAFKQEDRAWWCSKKCENRADKYKSDSIGNVIAWRIGWSCGALRGFGDESDELLSFLKSIDNGKTWECGRQRGVEQASFDKKKRKHKKKFPVHTVIVLRHAAWLLGWLMGYAKTRGVTAVGKHACGPGSRVGGTAAKYYLCLLRKHRWIKDPSVKSMLGIGRNSDQATEKSSGGPKSTGDSMMGDTSHKNH